MKKKIGSALVVGAGISGIRSALDLAELGYHVSLIDKAPNMGGTLAQLDYQFPTDRCGICRMLPLVERDSSSHFCLRKGLFHENIDLMLSTELVGLDGEPGKFLATLRQKSTMVDAERCIGCGECSRVCPVEVPDEFNEGLTKRKAVYLPVPHNIPNTYVVDMGACTNCGECVKICPTQAIDFQKDKRKGFRILVVDDELIVRDSLKEWLQEEGFFVEAAESGETALEMLNKESFHLLLLDIKMPGMDGVEVLKQAKDINPDLTVIMMTAYATVETAVEAMKLGARDYLMKPFDPDSLVPMMVKLYQDIERTGEREIEVGSVIFAAGFDSYNPSTGKDNYGYGRFANVLTSTEFERLVSGTGPNQGELLRPGDSKEAKKIAWLQCVGSRDVQEGADYCSSICCMFAVKEALLAKKRTDGKVDAAIFYMDMRTYGKEYQRYRDRAEKEEGVRFIRSRVHTVEQIDAEGRLRIVYSDTNGQRQEEIFDMVVLSSGQRPVAGIESLAEVSGIELDTHGFCRLQEFSLSRTSIEGIFAAGSFSGLKDISESVIQACSASSGASRLIHSKGGGLAEEIIEEKKYRDVSREVPMTFLALCSCGDGISKFVDLEKIRLEFENRGTATEVRVIEQACTREGWDELTQALKESSANRVLIGACMPYVYARKIKKLGSDVGLDPSLIDVVDIRTPVFVGQNSGGDDVSIEVKAILTMGMGKLRGQDPFPVPFTHVTQKAMVIGGGVAGMTAALTIADHGFEVALIERQENLGGNLHALHQTIEGYDPHELLHEMVLKLENHPKIQVFKKARVLYTKGRVGNFITGFEKEDGSIQIFEHGVTVMATGGREAKTQEYLYGESEAVLTQHELETGLEEETIDPSKLEAVAMIQCVGSRVEPRNYCSRVCCSTSLKHALYLKKKNPEIQIYILYRDMMSFGFLESYYRQAREAGVIFFQYDPDRKPQVALKDGKLVINVLDPILGRELIIPVDALVLATGIIPEDQKDLAGLFEISLNQDGFYQEADYKWRPVDTMKEGVFVCGIAHSPRSATESIAMAEAAAQRALRILNSERLAAGNLVAEVRTSLCSRCEICLDACPYGARWYDEMEDRIMLDELMCQGCGSCAAVCPNSASVLRGYKDQQVFEIIDAALEGLG